MTRSSDRNHVQREVRSDDPGLSPEANRVLTEELREAVGADHVTVPEDAPDRSGERHGRHSPFVTALISNGALIIITFVSLVVVGAIVALTTGAWWAVVVAAAVHAVGTMIVVGMAVAMSTETEHVSPEAAARLEEEGVADPDALLSERIEDYSGAEEARGTAEVVSSGYNERRSDTRTDPAGSAGEQRTALTPAGTASAPAGDHSAVAALPWLAVLGPLVVAVVVALVMGGGGWWWAPAVMAPFVAGWIVLHRRLGSAQEERDEGASEQPVRAPGDARAGMRKRVLPLTALVVGGVVAFLVVMGLITGYL
jgi:hypothetical protein